MCFLFVGDWWQNRLYRPLLPVQCHVTLQLPHQRRRCFPHSLNLCWPCDLLWWTECGRSDDETVPEPRSITSKPTGEQQSWWNLEIWVTMGSRTAHQLRNWHKRELTFHVAKSIAFWSLLKPLNQYPNSYNRIFTLSNNKHTISYRNKVGSWSRNTHMQTIDQNRELRNSPMNV